MAVISVTTCDVEHGSIAERHGFAPGDTIRRIDGHPIDDVLDYRFYMTAARLMVEGETAAGEPFSRAIRKDEYDDLGLLFDTYLMDRQRSCRNRCVFCFIDQLPPGLRDTLYFKDDDSRMSFLFGNYITLTNLRERDVERILNMHISPVNISVHTMNPALRVKMMANPHAGDVLRYVSRLAEGGVAVNTQLVLCPGINDGEELSFSLRELCALAPRVQSVAVVPVGLTKYRRGLAALKAFTPEQSRAVLETVGRFGDEMLALHGRRICYAADEFYLSAGRDVPPAPHYEEFAQLENGVGLLSLLIDEFTAALADEVARPINRRVTIATGAAAAPFLQRLADAATERFSGLGIDIAPIQNHFFGPLITVAGLVTGSDLLAQLTVRELGDELLIPTVMLRREGDLFLDDVSLDNVSKELRIPVHPVPNDGYRLLDAILGSG